MNDKSFFDVWPSIFLFDLLRYLVPTTIAFILFFWYGRRRWQHLIIQGALPQSKQMWTEFKYSMSTVVIFSLVGFCIYTAEQAGFTQIYPNLNDRSWGYFVLSLAVMIAFHDFYFYWTHRWMHHQAIFKYVHRVHHLSTNPSPWAAYSFHPIEAFVQTGVFLIIVFTLPTHGLALFIFLTYMIVRNVLGHVGFEFYPKGFLRNRLFNWNTSTTHHSMHHQFFNCNYGLYFTWWDDLFGTTHKRYKETFEDIQSRPKTSNKKTSVVMEKTISVIVLIFITTALTAQSVEGKWLTSNEETGASLSVVQIDPVTGSIQGKVVKIFIQPNEGEDPICTKCSDERKGQQVIGMNILKGFKKNGKNWSGGKILDPQNGVEYESKMWMADNNTLKVRGYGGPLGIFYRTQTWLRDKTSVQTGTLEGIWQTMDDTWNKVKSIISIEIQNEKVTGKVQKIYLMPNEGDDPQCTACNGDLKGKKIVGMKILGRI